MRKLLRDRRGVPAENLLAALLALAALSLSLRTALLTTVFSLLVLSSLLLAWRGAIASAREQSVAWVALGLFLWMGARVPSSEADLPLAMSGWLTNHELLALPVLLAVTPTAAQRRGVWTAFILGNLIGAGVSYARWLGFIPELHAPENFAPIRGPIGGAWLMSLAGFLCMVLLPRAAGWLRWLLIASLALFAGVLLFLIAGRTAYISILLLAMLLLAGQPWRRILAGVALMGLLSALAWTASPYMRERVIDTFTMPANSPTAISTGIRLDLYRVSAAAALDAPWIGHGTGSFSAVYERKAVELSTVRTRSDNPHNQYLLLWVENGLPGVVLFIGLLAAAWRQAHHLRSISARFLKALTLTMAASCLFNSFLLDGPEGRAFILLLALCLTDRKSVPERVEVPARVNGVPES